MFQQFSEFFIMNNPRSKDIGEYSVSVCSKLEEI